MTRPFRGLNRGTGPDRSYDARLVIRADEPMLGAALSIAGFRPTGQGYIRTHRGQF